MFKCHENIQKMVGKSFLMGIVTWDNVLFVCIEYSSNELNLSQSYETKKPIRMSVNILWAFQVPLFLLPCNHSSIFRE